jgi:ribonuclease Z
VSALVQPRLVNGPFGDPGVFVDFRFGRRAILFDLGDLSPLSSRELLRVSHVFVSHAHVDHVFGFDLLLRLCLHRPEPLHLTGPEGFADRVAGKLRGYTWNLLDEDSPDFAIIAAEFVAGRIARQCIFRAREAFQARRMEPEDLPPGLVHREADFTVEAAVLDHGTPSLAFALQERLRVNVWKEGLAALGLPVGPWLNEAKRLARNSAPDATPIEAPGRSITLGDLKEHALRIAPGQRVAYVTDAAGHPENAGKIITLCAGADRLFIEAVFRDADLGLAEQNRHLTARQAGDLARRAGVGRVTPFHFSSRYSDCEEELRREVREGFEGLS